MSANEFGKYFKIMSFGESHGNAMGVVIDGMPAGLPIDENALAKDLSRRRPGQSRVVSSRQESDHAEILSGVFENKSLGSPIAVMVRNQDARSKDYESIKNNPRIGHADDVWQSKYQHVDHRGGGRSSGRETISRVIAGSFAKQLLCHALPDLKVFSFTSSIHTYAVQDSDLLAKLKDADWERGRDWIDSFSTRMPHDQHQEVEELLSKAKEEGKSYGGYASVAIFGLPAGWGQPVFHKLKSDLAAAYMGVGATQSFHLGGIQDMQELEGSDFHQQAQSTNYGGIRGGISTGETIFTKVGFKPTSSVKDVAKKGRHDPCILPRAVVVLEAMTYLVLADHLLWRQGDNVDKICT